MTEQNKQKTEQKKRIYGGCDIKDMSQMCVLATADVEAVWGELGAV